MAAVAAVDQETSSGGPAQTAAQPGPGAAGKGTDPVDLAGPDSFPASDAPDWSGIVPGRPANDGSEARGGNDNVVSFRDVALRRRLAEAPVPNPAQGQRVHIHQPSRSTRQAGRGGAGVWVIEFEPLWPPAIEPLMGWTGSRDPLSQLRLTFPDRDSAVAFATRQGWRYSVSAPQRPRTRNSFPAGGPAWQGITATSVSESGR